MGGSRTVAGVALRWGARTDVGRVRSVNEDSMLAEAPVFLVADGMGGHEAGDVASALAVQSVSALVDSAPDDPEEVSRVLGEANDGIIAAGSSQPEDRAMGTTAVGLVLLGGEREAAWMLFNIGDSRIYRLFEGRLSQLSTDHSYVQELIDAGRISPSAALTHPQRNVVTRALGVEDQLEVDLWLRSPVPGERFLLCSDGLSGELTHGVIEDLMGSQAEPEDLCAELVDRALAAGGSDNITAVVVEVESVDGVGAGEYDTNPRGAATAEHRAVPTIATSAPRGVDVAGPSGGSGAMIEVPEDILGGPPGRPRPVEDGSETSDRGPFASAQRQESDPGALPASMIEGIPVPDSEAGQHNEAGRPNKVAAEFDNRPLEGTVDVDPGDVESAMEGEPR